MSKTNHCLAKRRPTRQHRRGGALYIAVLSTALIVSLLGLTGISIVRIERKEANSINGMLIARSNARSSVELALRVIADDPNWRTTYTNGVKTTPQSLGPNGTGTVSWVLEDSDGSLTDADIQLRLKGVGRVGDTVQVSSIQLQPAGDALSCLEVALHAGNSLSFTGTTVQCNQTISANNSVGATTSTINSNVEAVTAITGSTYNGTNTTPIDPRTMPGGTVFDFYTNPVNGTYIDVSMLSKQGSTSVLKNIVLSPATNPFGPINPAGIYVIDLMGRRLKIQTCRIVGTLVLLNGASDSTAYNNNIWEPAVPNYPVLMVQGDFEFNVDGGDPIDEFQVNLNLNPPGTPYNGEEDTLLDDTFSVNIKGLVYVSGNASITSSIVADSLVFDGIVIVGGTLNSNGNLNLTYQSTFLDNPPPGFSEGNSVSVKPGSWQWDVAP